MSDVHTTLTTGGFIATVLALILAIIAYVISRRAQGREQERTPESETFESPAPEANQGREVKSADPAADVSAHPYRWD